MADVPESTTTRVRRAGGRLLAFLRRWLTAVVLVIVGLGTSSAIVLVHGESLSPIDEWVYVDYLYKIPEQGIVLKGDPVGDEALEIMACDGVTPYGPMGDPCGSDYDYADFPFGGISTADVYSPLYFYATRIVGDGLAFVTGTDEVTGWRLTSPLWLVAGLIMLTVLLRSWRVNEWAILALGLAFLGSPFSYWTYTYVSTDAPAFFFGAFLLYLATRFVRGENRGWSIVIVSVVASLLKVTNMLGVGLAVLFLLIHAVRERFGSPSSPTGVRPSPLRQVLIAVGATVAAAVAQGIWLTINRVTALTDLRANQGIGGQLTIESLLGQVTNFLPGTIVSNVNLAGSTGYALPIPGYATAPLSWVCIAGVLAAFWWIRGSREQRSLIVTVAISAAVFAPLLALALQVVTSSYFTLPPRYGASILPGFLLLAGMMLRNRWAALVLGLYGIALAAVLVYGGAVLGPYF